MRIESMEESCQLGASMRKCVPAQSSQDEGADLVVSQIKFGLAYAREAHSAYESGNYEYGEVARKIAVNAYSAALRFSSHLLREPQASLTRQIEELEMQLDGLMQPVESGLRSIA